MRVELHAASAFSFLRGASLPEDLVERAAELGYDAVALVDRDGLAGAPRFFKAAKARGIRPLVGAELSLDGGGVLPLSAPDEPPTLPDRRARERRFHAAMAWSMNGRMLMQTSGTTSVDGPIASHRKHRTAMRPSPHSP